MTGVSTLIRGITAYGSVEESKIEVNYVRTDDQLADILTKSLGQLKFLEMRRKIGVQAVKTGTSCLGG